MPHEPKRRRIGWVGMGVSIGAAIVGMFWWGSSGAAEKKFLITGPNGLSMELNAKKSEIGHEELLKQMDCTPFVRAGNDRVAGRKRHLPHH